jgi:uncharacterized protein (DUF2141 family)
MIRLLFVSYFLFSANWYYLDKPLSSSRQMVKDHIDLTIRNLNKTAGLVRIGIFTSETGYPDHPAFNYSLAKDSLKNGLLRLVIPVDKPGYISISVLDDENENGKMDYRFGILPKEGFGFSNNPKIKSRKAPSFNVTSFRFSGGERKIEINMVYM